MIRINLLPTEERRSELPLYRIFSVVGVFVVLILICIYSYGYFTTSNIESKIQEKRTQYELLKPTQEKMRVTEAKVQQINAKNNILLSLTQERKSWHAIMTHIGVVKTPNVWLTEVGLADKNSFKIKGLATSYPDLATFIKKLEQDDLFLDVALVNSEKLTNDRDYSAGVANFELLVKIKGM
ncbi:PilN domain-containing protein [Dendrosporobacter sp. 1207_IL3150]|uniref:PilN domain-containing protein n=1 Tax=Dendrosporobacter sp. 1207_IL3150 TaxID=3084054 RepID=UPI002FD8BAE4